MKLGSKSVLSQTCCQNLSSFYHAHNTVFLVVCTHVFDHTDIHCGLYLLHLIGRFLAGQNQQERQISYLLILLSHTWKHIETYYYLAHPLDKDKVYVYYVPLKTNETQADMVLFGYIVYKLATTLSRY